MELVPENWQVFQDRAFSLVEQEQIKKTEKNNGAGINSFLNMGGKGFI